MNKIEDKIEKKDTIKIENSNKNFYRRSLYCMILYRCIKNIIVNSKNCVYYHNKFANKYYYQIPSEYITCVRNDYYSTIIANSIGIIIGSIISFLIVFYVAHLIDKIFYK